MKKSIKFLTIISFIVILLIVIFLNIFNHVDPFIQYKWVDDSFGDYSDSQFIPILS